MFVLVMAVSLALLVGSFFYSLNQQAQRGREGRREVCQAENRTKNEIRSLLRFFLNNPQGKAYLTPAFRNLGPDLRC